MSLLYHLRVMPLVIEGLGRLLMRVLGTSGAESFSTVADIFVGQTEGAFGDQAVFGQNVGFRAQCLHGGGVCNHRRRRARGLRGDAQRRRAGHCRSLRSRAA